jgi:hypothetical protein
MIDDHSSFHLFTMKSSFQNFKKTSVASEARESIWNEDNILEAFKKMPFKTTYFSPPSKLIDISSSFFDYFVIGIKTHLNSDPHLKRFIEKFEEVLEEVKTHNPYQNSLVTLPEAIQIIIDQFTQYDYDASVLDDIYDEVSELAWKLEEYFNCIKISKNEHSPPQKIHPAREPSGNKFIDFKLDFLDQLNYKFNVKSLPSDIQDKIGRLNDINAAKDFEMSLNVLISLSKEDPQLDEFLYFIESVCFL